MAGRREVRGLPWCSGSCYGFSLVVAPDVGAFLFYFIFLKLRFAQESYLVGSDVGK